jgi:hypothetical protein
MGGEWGHGTFACCEEGPAFCFLQGYLCGMCTIAKAAELSGNGQSCMINAIALACIGQVWGFLIRKQYAQA